MSREDIELVAAETRKLVTLLQDPAVRQEMFSLVISAVSTPESQEQLRAIIASAERLNESLRRD